MAQEQQAQDVITARAMRDEVFRQRLLRDPKAALLEIGVTVPPGMTIHVHEETASDVHIIVPGAPQSGLQELSDADLELVAGGMRPIKPGTGCCTCGSSTAQSFSSVQMGCGC